MATVVATSICAGAITRRTTAGAIPSIGTSVAMAAAAVEQNGQRCVLLFPPVKSAQKWNCASRNTSASTTAAHILLVGNPILKAIVGPKSYRKSTLYRNGAGSEKLLTRPC
jgi:hypothetical protein